MDFLLLSLESHKKLSSKVAADGSDASPQIFPTVPLLELSRL